jgi:hypothetical protein
LAILELSKVEKRAVSIINLKVSPLLKKAAGENYREFFRSMFDIDNSMFMSIDDTPYESYTLCILDAPVSRVSEETEVVIAEGGTSGPYLLPVVPIEFWIRFGSFDELLTMYRDAIIPSWEVARSERK